MIHDILIPAMKNAFVGVINGGVDALKNTVENVIYKEIGGNHNVSRRVDTRKPYVPYNCISNSTRPVNRVVERSLYDFSTIILNSRIEAENVLAALEDSIYTYKQVTVAEFQELVGMRSDNYTDNRYGWYDLRRARIVQARGGWYIDLPKPISLI